MQIDSQNKSKVINLFQKLLTHLINNIKMHLKK